MQIEWQSMQKDCSQHVGSQSACWQSVSMLAVSQHVGNVQLMPLPVGVDFKMGDVSKAVIPRRHLLHGHAYQPACLRIAFSPTPLPSYPWTCFASYPTFHYLSLSLSLPLPLLLLHTLPPSDLM